MEVKKTPLLFQQELNTFYKDILNCEITHPRYREWRVPETFFLRKRRWIDLYFDWGWDEVLDYILYAGKEYALVRDWNNLDVKVRWVNWPETISRDTYNINVNHSFKEWFQSVKWQILTRWTSISYVESTDPEYTPDVPKLKDSSANRTDWAYAWKYVYLMPWTHAWWWQIFKISNNTSQYLFIQTWLAELPYSCPYKIFDDYWECLSFIWSTYVYSIVNDQVQSTTTISDWLIAYWEFSETWFEVIDCDWNNWRLFVIRKDWSILCTATTNATSKDAVEWWMFAWYTNSSSMIWYVQWAIRIMKFNNIEVVFTKNKIYLIKSTTVSVQWIDDNWQQYTFTHQSYIVNLAFWFLWLHNMKAVCPYNTWIYFLSNKNTFLSLNIEETYYNYYRTTTEDMWVDIQQWLDNVWPNDPISIWINAETIYISWKQETYTTLFQFDVYYKFWHRWVTQIPIKNLYISTDSTFLWPKTYRYNLNENMLDYENLDYTQQLRFIHWDSDVFSLKTILYHKIFLWPETDEESYVLYKARLSTWTYKYKIPFNNVDYLHQINNLSLNNTLWNSLLWYQVLWWISENSLIWTLVADIDVIDIPLWLTYSLLEITIVWQFEIWWNLLWALVHDDHITPYEDVVPYFS